MTNEEKKWYVVYTRPRWEKKVARLLVEKDVETYCPLSRERRKWSDRMKLVEIPLFASYVFIRIPEQAKPKVREVEGIINFVYQNGKPALVRDKEIERIKRFLDEYECVQAVKEIIPDDQVQVSTGLFLDQQGTVLNLINSKAKVQIESLGYTLVALFDKSRLIAE